jgi:predicted porin
LESSDNVVASLNLKADFTERTTAELTVSRKVNPSIVTPDNNYEATRAQLDLRQKAWKNKVTFLAGIAYENDEYQKRFTIAPGVLKGRQDDYYEFRAGVDYDITKNVLVGLLYQFHENRSTIKTLSFDQNVATVRALLHF